MRILLVSPYFPPQNAVACLRVHAFAQCWANAGEQVTVLTTAKRNDQSGLDLPRHGFEVAELEYQAPRVLELLRRYSKSGIDGAGATLIKNKGRAPAMSRKGTLRRWLGAFKERTGIFSSVRMPDLTDAWVKPAIAWARDRGPWECVVSSSGPYTAHRVALAIKRHGLARKWIADFRDLWTDNHLHAGLIPFTLQERRVENQCLHEADVLTTVSDGLATTLRRKSMKPVEIIYNGFDAQMIDSLPATAAFPQDDRVRLVYTGTLYPQGQDPSPLLKAMAQLGREYCDLAKRLTLVVAGQGGESWFELADKYGVEEMIEPRGIVDRSEALRMQRDADALLLLDWIDARQGVLTAKVFEYLQAAAPIILIGAANGSPLTALVHHAGRGIQTGNDERRIMKTLVDLIKDPLQIQPARNEDFIATLSRQQQSARMLECMRRLAE